MWNVLHNITKRHNLGRHLVIRLHKLSVAQDLKLLCSNFIIWTNTGRHGLFGVVRSFVYSFVWTYSFGCCNLKLCFVDITSGCCFWRVGVRSSPRVFTRKMTRDLSKWKIHTGNTVEMHFFLDLLVLDALIPRVSLPGKKTPKKWGFTLYRCQLHWLNLFDLW